MNTPFIVPCRKPVGHTPTDLHENTHTLHSELRNKYGNKYNAMYRGDGSAFILLEPQVTLATIAVAIPQPLRGMSYNLYLVQQQRWWNQQPLYLIDELGAYLSGSRHPNSEFSDYLQAMEFVIYNFYLIKIVPFDYTDYNNLKTAIMWATEQAFQHADHPRVKEYLNKFDEFKDDIRTKFPFSWFDLYFGE
jgi:hypothetical protein